MKFIDMFCGIGTIRMGFEQAGHECVYSIEWDKHKRRIYNVIFGQEPEGRDIRTIRAVDIPRADCWCFGAPCQDFSIAGKRQGLEGDRSSLVREVFRLVRETKEECRPKYLFYENVKGMFSSNKGLDYFKILCEMDELGYDIEWQLLNSKDFGVPQNRERVFTIGHLRSRGRQKIFPITGGNSQTLKQIIPKSDAQRVAEDGGQGTKTGLYLVNGTKEGKVYCLDANYAKGCNDLSKGRRTMVEVRSVLTPNRLNKRQNGRRFKEPNEPMFTLTKQDIHSVEYQGRIRRLTPKECWRLQGIPDKITDKVIAAGISDTQMYRGAGDATTVNVIYEIAKRME
ncbi:DNA (cytosine-5-)-methyltransferase [Clostridium felsineum]|uniref:DNA (cytosine-5-)-methyltransferase n=1 Tax=Clostridium felsineum TaxID=36839 RepID=UPI00214D2047|nr:DNA (cytosine-5-)-methyltransferase [Clostridium felsineum]MCR3759187.1 DNA (cytosine-5-)-methyltransferase [Clostridium felsineum]